MMMMDLAPFFSYLLPREQVISPNESEWFGYFQDGSQSELWRMKEAPWYQVRSSQSIIDAFQTSYSMLAA